MGWLDSAGEPQPQLHLTTFPEMTHAVKQLIKPHIQDLGGFQARRSLPHPDRTLVGPFIFFDHLGPATFPAGFGVDVRPHPHINLATVTYLFEGVLLHRDSLGSVQAIYPGAVNWMTAGRGIVHSERSPAADRGIESTLHAIQTWVALPDDQEETEPTFHHYPASDMPIWEQAGVTLKLIAGTAYDQVSPVVTYSPILYLDVQMAEGSKFSLPQDYSERAIYSVSSELRINDQTVPQHRLAVLEAGASVDVQAPVTTRCMVIGGEPVGERHKWWNFVSSRRDRIEQAKADWKSGRFATVPKETEFIPLPEEG